MINFHSDNEKHCIAYYRHYFYTQIDMMQSLASSIVSYVTVFTTNLTKSQSEYKKKIRSNERKKERKTKEIRTIFAKVKTIEISYIAI